MKDILTKLFAHEILSQEESREVLIKVARAEFNQSQVASFLTVYLMRPISVSELLGFREALLELATPIDFSEFDCIDMCGTGGDGKNTFNVSTLSSLVVAGAGYKVAKHGNYGSTSVCGSSNILEYLGYEFTTNSDKLKSDLDKANICFMHAPHFHSSVKNVATIRKELGIKTFFNILGPLVNPARVKKQMIGVYSLEVARIYSYVVKHFLDSYSIVHSLDGYDEISLTADYKIIDNKGENIISPKANGFKMVKPEQILGADTIEKNAKLFETVLKGEGTDAQSNVVLLNSATAIRTIEPKLTPFQALEQAQDSLFGGKAYNSLKLIVKV
jgi:anthranilate phosphoribosyltransferase